MIHIWRPSVTIQRGKESKSSCYLANPYLKLVTIDFDILSRLEGVMLKNQNNTHLKDHS